MKWMQLAFLLFGIAPLSAQSFNLDELSEANGLWKGTLSYRDYSSDKRVSIPTHLELHRTAKGVELLYTYPEEPQANSREVIRLRKGNTFFGKHKIVSFDRTSEGKKLVTTSLGSDNGKKATFFHTYQWSASHLSMRKDVQYIGETEKNFRNEYEFER